VLDPTQPNATPQTTAPLTAPTATSLTVTDTAGLLSALWSAHPGDTIELAPGVYNPLRVDNLQINGTVTITSADPSHPAVLNGVTLYSDSGLAFDHLNVAVNGDVYGVVVNGSSNLSFSSLAIHGTSAVDQGAGMTISNSSAISVTGSDLSHLGSGIGHSNDAGVTISNNTFHDLENDGVYGAGSTNVVISGNHFQDFHPQAADHPDAIQLWGNASGVTITNNVIERGDGAVLQGIFIEDSSNLVITGNAMVGTMFNGISLISANQALIEDNFVEGFSDMESRIITRASTDVTVSGNSAEVIINGPEANPGYVDGGNTLIGPAALNDLSAIDAWLIQNAQAPIVVGSAGDPTGGVVTNGPAPSDPTSSAPVVSDPTASTPVANDPTSSTPVVSDPTASAPVASDPTASAPVVSDPTASTPMADPTAGVTVVSDPTAGAPVTTAPVASAPVVSDPTAGHLAINDPTANGNWHHMLDHHSGWIV
jgi:hypothetical protein